MLMAMAVVLLVLSITGIASGYTLDNVVYGLLAMSLMLFVIGLLSNRRRRSQQR